MFNSFVEKNKTIMTSVWKGLYENADPFPHIVIDGLFDDNILTKAIEQFPDSKKYRNDDWVRFFNANEKFKSSYNGQHLDEFPTIFKVLQFMNSNEFVSFLRELLGIPTLESDSTFWGGGLHETSRGGHLGVHLDFSKYKSLWRRANCLLYLNKDWKESYGGHLELYDNKPSEGGKCVKKILPVFNRLVIFGTSKQSWHGHPTPLTCPEDNKRRSLATYYYSKDSGEDTTEHDTIF